MKADTSDIWTYPQLHVSAKVDTWSLCVQDAPILGLWLSAAFATYLDLSNLERWPLVMSALLAAVYMGSLIKQQYNALS
jgi:hypothetical protein